MPKRHGYVEFHVIKQITKSSILRYRGGKNQTCKPILFSHTLSFIRHAMVSTTADNLETKSGEMASLLL